MLKSCDLSTLWSNWSFPSVSSLDETEWSDGLSLGHDWPVSSFVALNIPWRLPCRLWKLFGPPVMDWGVNAANWCCCDVCADKACVAVTWYGCWEFGFAFNGGGYLDLGIVRWTILLNRFLALYNKMITPITSAAPVVLWTISTIMSLSMSRSVFSSSEVFDLPVLMADEREKKADSRVFLASISCFSSVDLVRCEPFEDPELESSWLSS